MNKEFEPRNNNSLEQTLASLKDMQEVNPDSGFKANARIRLLNRIASQQIGTKPTAFLAKPFQFALAGLLIFLVGGIGTVFAAQSSLPSDTLYPVKTASEQTLLAVSPPSYKGRVALMIADRRADEVKKLNNLGKNALLPNAVTKYEQSIKQIQEVDRLPQEVIDQHLSTHQQVLQEVLQKVPSQAKPAIENAIKASDNAKGKNNNPGLQHRGKQ